MFLCCNKSMLTFSVNVNKFLILVFTCMVRWVDLMHAISVLQDFRKTTFRTCMLRNIFVLPTLSVHLDYLQIYFAIAIYFYHRGFVLFTQYIVVNSVLIDILVLLQINVLFLICHVF